MSDERPVDAMTDPYAAKAREIADPRFIRRIMFDVVNAWHREVGIDEVMKTKLTRAIADTVATGVFEEALRPALREAVAAENERCARVAEEHSSSGLDSDDPIASSNAIGYMTAVEQIATAIRESKP